MPELAGVDLEERVAALVQARRAQLAELVRAKVDEELARLVAIEVEQRTNGAGNMSRGITPTDITTRRCKSCGETKAVDQFEKHRHTCRSCRARQRAATSVRPRHAADAGEDPRPGGTTQAD